MANDDEFVVAPPEDRRRVLFAGSEAEAQRYMDENFPWPHSDGNRLIHSAILIHPDGKTHQTYHRGEGWSELLDREGDPVQASAVPSEYVYDPAAVQGSQEGTQL